MKKLLIIEALSRKIREVLEGKQQNQSFII